MLNLAQLSDRLTSAGPALSIVLAAFSFSVFFTFGFVNAVGLELVQFLDGLAISALFFQAVLCLGFAVAMCAFLLRIGTYEGYRDKSLVVLLKTKPELVLPMSVMLVLFFEHYFAPGALIANFYRPALFLAFLFAWFSMSSQRGNKWLPERILQLCRTLMSRPGLVKRVVKSEVRRFLASTAPLVVLALASWLGYARAEYLMGQSAELVGMDFAVDGPMAPILNQGAATIFVNGTGHLVRISNANYTLVES